MITITEITYDKIIFSNGDVISWWHEYECSEENYADFDQIQDCVGMKFDEPIQFEPVQKAGFRFGNGINMVFVPCYTIQNGFYSNIVDVLYHHASTGKKDHYRFDSKFHDNYDNYDDYEDD